MNETELYRKLQALGAEIEKTQVDDPQQQAVLDELKVHIQHVLDEPDGSHHLSLAGRLRKGLVVFEIEHPALTRTMEMVSEHLSSLGI